MFCFTVRYKILICIRNIQLKKILFFSNSMFIQCSNLNNTVTYIVKYSVDQGMDMKQISTCT